MTIEKFKFANFETAERRLYNENKCNIVTLGAGSYIVDATMEYMVEAKAHVLIGKYSSLASDIKFYIGLNHNYRNVSTYPFDNIDGWLPYCVPDVADFNNSQIIVGNDVWVGNGVTFLSGVHIGNGAVIGANSTVAKDIPPYAVAVGNPARVIKYRFSEEVISKLQAIKWWNWSVEQIRTALPFMNNINEFIVRYGTESRQSAKNQTVEEIARLHKDYRFYHFCPDTDTDQPLWKRFMQRYIQSYNINDPVILLLWIDEKLGNVYCVEEIQKMLVQAGEEAPRIMTYSGNKEVMADIVSSMDVIITTKSLLTMDIIDNTTRMDKKIVYADDFGA